ncbi:hypothetical protein [Pseudorhodoferax sp. Leaf265]|uniref:hypothetical protein n=1 Tax=Pseudorhodoferax sp. Leaf265 TaxID=1736315 RepID=UPI0006F44D6E|nr:hypothetical protein [Pseudorhodoferax sp. Leaf265]KQP19900.1 hypothetical protein ASF45_22620 [Pseudorhodoferax sp. Leaf265]
MPLHRRRCLFLTFAALPAIGQAGFNFFTGEYTASHAELQALVEKQFPLEQRYAEIFRVRLQDPRLGLNAPVQRTGLTAALTIASPWLRGGQVGGTVALSSALRWDAAARALRLDRPSVEHLELQGLAGGDAERLRRIAAVVAQELLHDHVLRSFTREEMTVGLKTYEVGAITVLDEGIKIQLE